jgi:hypothetical protein
VSQPHSTRVSAAGLALLRLRRQLGPNCRIFFVVTVGLGQRISQLRSCSTGDEKRSVGGTTGRSRGPLNIFSGSDVLFGSSMSPAKMLDPSSLIVSLDQLRSLWQLRLCDQFHLRWRIIRVNRDALVVGRR